MKKPKSRLGDSGIEIEIVPAKPLEGSFEFFLTNPYYHEAIAAIKS